MIFYGLSNIDMSITDPTGNMISAMYTSVAGGQHELIDEDLDGTLDDRLMNFSPMDGEYTLVFKPRYPDKPVGTFSAFIRTPFHEFRFFNKFNLCQIIDIRFCNFF